MSGEAIGWAFRKVQMDDATAKFVLVALCNYANDEDEAWPSHASISRLTGLSKRTIQNGIQKLEDWGIIKRIRRDRGNGSETSAMVSIDLDVSWIVKGGIATPATGGVATSAIGVAADATLETTLKPQSKSSRPAKQQDGTYSEEFEALWQLYPRTKNTSKKKAHDIWRMLNTENRARVTGAVPIFAAAMRAEGRPEDKIPHMTSWLNGKMYETAAAPASAPASKQTAADWHKTATREQWAKILVIWSGTNDWRASWGPSPDEPGCCVPADMIAEHNVKHRGFMFSEEQLEAFRSQVRAPIKPAQAAE